MSQKDRTGRNGKTGAGIIALTAFKEGYYIICLALKALFWLMLGCVYKEYNFLRNL